MATVVTGERRIVSVLIADVVNSTGIGERLGPERSKFLMDEVLRIMARRSAATTARSSSASATRSSPSSALRSPTRTIPSVPSCAALAIQRAIARYSDEVRDAYGVELSVRVGVNTGQVVDPRPTTAPQSRSAGTRSATP